ncbi:hypothetical protein N7470_007503 [Penicillium chermesinum]|nr:hypothetical protein N7470_007503 [Penicillium chermesinum]
MGYFCRGFFPYARPAHSYTGFAMSYGIFQEYYFDNWTFKGSKNVSGVIGTTANGVMYLSMPFLFALFTRRWAHLRQVAAFCGTIIACISFLLSSFTPQHYRWGEWYTTSNRALAYGIVLSCKNIVGTSCPFIIRALIDTYGFKTTMRAWTAIVGGLSIFSILLIPTHPSKLTIHRTRARKIPWTFLKHRSIYFYSIAIIFQSSGYGIPQSYLPTYARDIAKLSQTSVVSAIPPVSSALATFLLWGLTTEGNIGLLIVFSMTFGFFSSGYSATWGGMLKQMEFESAERNEAVDSGMLYGLLNGVRGIGYASGGVAGIELLKAGTISGNSRFVYGTSYGPLILFTGLSSLLGGWVLLWRWNPTRLLPLLGMR